MVCLIDSLGKFQMVSKEANSCVHVEMLLMFIFISQVGGALMGGCMMLSPKSHSLINVSSIKHKLQILVDREVMMLSMVYKKSLSQLYLNPIYSY